MKLFKYDGVADKTLKLSLTGNGTSTTTNNSSNNPPSRGDSGVSSGDRYIWGQYDEGDDISGTATISGDVIVKAIVPPVYEPDPDEDEGDGEYEDEEEGGGNIIAECDIKGNRLFCMLDNKQINVADYLKRHDVSINNLNTRVDKLNSSVVNLNTKVINLNSSVINLNSSVGDLYVKVDSLNNSVTSINTKVNALDSSVSSLSLLLSNHINDSTSKFDYVYDMIDSHSDDIEDLSTRLSKISAGNTGGLNPDGSTNSPVILFSGIATRSGTTYSISGSKNEKISLSPSVYQGMMTITVDVSSGYQANIYAVSVVQRSSSDTASLSNTFIQTRNEGAFWFESRVNSVTDTTKIYIREFHQADGNNDSWDSTTWTSKLQSVNIIVTGYISIKETVVEPDPDPVTEDFYIQIYDNSYRTHQITGVYLFDTAITQDMISEMMLNSAEAMEYNAMAGSIDTAYYKASIIDNTVRINRGYGTMTDIPILFYANVYITIPGYSIIYGGQVRIEPNGIGSAIPVNISSL